MQDNTSQSGSPCSDYRKYSNDCARNTEDSNIRETYLQVAGNYEQVQIGIAEEEKSIHQNILRVSEGALLVKAHEILSCSCVG